MAANAFWLVTCEVTSPAGQKWEETVSLSSPDLTNVKEAHRRARKTAEERLLKKQQRAWGEGRKVKVRALRTQCVG